MISLTHSYWVSNHHFSKINNTDHEIFEKNLYNKKVTKSKQEEKKLKQNMMEAKESFIIKQKTNNL